MILAITAIKEIITSSHNLSLERMVMQMLTSFTVCYIMNYIIFISRMQFSISIYENNFFENSS